MAAAALVAVLVPASGHADEPDTTPPVLHALAFPASVATGPDGFDLTVTATITDDVSGVAAGSSAPTCSTARLQTQVALKSPSSTVFIGAIFDPRGGEAYQALLESPRYAQSGTWVVDRVTLSDCGGNSRTLTTPELAAAGFPTSLEVTGQGDDTPPTLTALAISPPSVDTSGDSAEVIVTATITDDLSGVAVAAATTCGRFGFPSSITFRSPSGSAFQGGLFEATGGDGYRAIVRMPRFAEPGTWTAFVSLNDCARNARPLTTVELAASGFPTSLEVTGVGDGTAPAVSALSIEPAVVDTRASGVEVLFSARLTDDLSGVAALEAPCDEPRTQVGVVSPSGQGFAGGLFRHRGGDDYEATVALPRFAEPGTWTVRMILVDCVGNTRHLESADLAALGLPSTLRVLPPAYDFGGFFAPLDAEALAERKAGSAMAVKFELGGAVGTDVFEAGFPQVQEIDCATRAPLGDASSLGATEWVFQGLADGVYQYKWKSSVQWRGSCRRLILGFDDGSRHTADVHFR